MITFIDFPELAAQERRAERAAEHLQRALGAVTATPPDGERWAVEAKRFRQAADEAEAAARQLRELCGWLDAASAAADEGVLDVPAGATMGVVPGLRPQRRSDG